MRSGRGTITDATYDLSAAAFDNPDHADIVIHNYRWRLSLAPGESRFDADESRLAGRPAVTVPTITIARNCPLSHLPKASPILSSVACRNTAA